MAAFFYGLACLIMLYYYGTLRFSIGLCICIFVWKFNAYYYI